MTNYPQSTTSGFRTTIQCLIFATCCGSAFGDEPAPSPRVLQEITALSSQQFYTQFALTRTMLEGSWDQKVFDQFSYYDGVNLQTMQRYAEKFKDDKKWGPFFAMKNALHLGTYKKLQPLIERKRRGEKLTDADRKLLEELDKKILEKLIK